MPPSSPSKPAVIFDHINVLTHQPEQLQRFFAEALGFAPGWRPPFPFAGNWLYREDDAFVHTVDSADPAHGVATLGHIAFRTTEDPDTLIERLRNLGYQPEVRRVPQRGDTQVFVALPGGLLVEIDSSANGGGEPPARSIG
jgi:catechol 2,3-dioxygenase-like lactoylglutathione lyase family enzyme